MKNEHLRDELLLKLVAIIIGVLGLVMMAVAVTLWRLFDVIFATSVTFVAGVFLLLMAIYCWRNRCHFTEKRRWVVYGLISSFILFALLFSLFTAPNITSLPLYHPKTLACLALAVASWRFAARARRMKSVV